MIRGVTQYYNQDLLHGRVVKHTVFNLKELLTFQPKTFHFL